MGIINLRTLTGEYREMATESLDQFGTDIDGALLKLGDPGYDSARQIWNRMVDRKPGIIVRCRGANDVAKTVDFARANHLLLSVRGGGHNIAGMAVSDGGIMIDLSEMKQIHVDPESRQVIVQPGATWGEVDRQTQPHGLAIPSGIVSTTGVAGLTLGGGFGWLTRTWGYTCDNLRSVQIVTADGQIRRASKHEHPDLFWGVRGGGGNFGVVTEFEFEARPVGPTVLAGLILYPMAQADDLVRVFRELTATAPDELTCLFLMRIAPPAPFIPEAVHGKPVVGIAVCYAGAVTDGQRLIEPLKSFGSPLADTIAPKPFVEHQAFLDSGQPHGRCYYWKSEYLPAIHPDLGAVLTEHSKRLTSPYSSVLMMHLGGAVKRMDPDESAAGHRDANYIVNLQASWDDPAASDTHVQWAREAHAALLPYSAGEVYVNFLTEDEGNDRIRQAYSPAAYQRLVTLKDKYDPLNLFRLNKNIEPSGVQAASSIAGSR